MTLEELNQLYDQLDDKRAELSLQGEKNSEEYRRIVAQMGKIEAEINRLERLANKGE